MNAKKTKKETTSEVIPVDSLDELLNLTRGTFTEFDLGSLSVGRFCVPIFKDLTFPLTFPQYLPPGSSQSTSDFFDENSNTFGVHLSHIFGNECFVSVFYKNDRRYGRNCLEIVRLQNEGKKEVDVPQSNSESFDNLEFEKVYNLEAFPAGILKKPGSQGQFLLTFKKRFHPMRESPVQVMRGREQRTREEEEKKKEQKQFEKEGGQIVPFFKNFLTAVLSGGLRNRVRNKLEATRRHCKRNDDKDDDDDEFFSESDYCDSDVEDFNDDENKGTIVDHHIVRERFQGRIVCNFYNVCASVIIFAFVFWVCYLSFLCCSKNARIFF